MAYTIRYGPKSRYGRPPGWVWKAQLWGSGVLLIGLLVLNQLDDGVRTIFTVEQPTVLEEATAVFARDIAQGIWWVEGLTNFCRAMLSYG